MLPSFIKTSFWKYPKYPKFFNRVLVNQDFNILFCNFSSVAMSLVDSTAASTLRCDEIDDTKQMGLLLAVDKASTHSRALLSQLGRRINNLRMPSLISLHKGYLHCLACVRLESKGDFVLNRKLTYWRNSR